MQKFNITCREEIGTQFTLKAPDRETADAWIRKHGADVVSNMPGRQEVYDRDYEVILVDDDDDDTADFVTEGGT